MRSAETDRPIALGSLDVQIDGQTLESWSNILDQFADASIYQSWAYGAVRWGARHLSHLVIRKGDQVVAAAQLRIARLPLVRAGVAYLRWGPLCHRKGQKLEPTIMLEVVKCLREEYCHRRGLTLQVVPNAYADEARGAAYQEAFMQSGLRSEPAGPNYRTVLVDLEPVPEVMRKCLDQKWRNQLNRSEKNGLVLEVSESRDAFRAFLRLYVAMWERKRFETSVDVEEFDRVQALLSGPARMQTFLARKDGDAVAALVVSLFGDTGIYLLGATDEKARELKASYFLQWSVMMWLKERDARRYDLGGIDSESNPGGYHFKSGFGGADLTQLERHVCQGSLLSVGVAALSAWHRRRTSSKVPVETAR